jgi:hypothetical protein
MKSPVRPRQAIWSGPVAINFIAKIEVLIFTIEVIALLLLSGIRECHVSPDDLANRVPTGLQNSAGFGLRKHPETARN